MENVINSTSNRQIREIAKLLGKAKERREKQCFVVEGVRMFLETPPGRIQKVYVSESFFSQEKNRRMLDKKQTLYEVVSDRVFQSMSDTVTPQGILALVAMREITPDQLLLYRQKKKQENPGRIFTYLMLENIQDPGNLGTMVRTAEGAGISGIIADRTTADLYNPKVVRSTMGSVYRVPYAVTENMSQTLEQFRKSGIVVCAADMEQSISYDSADFKRDVSILIGNEGNGISPTLLEQAETRVHIPMAGKVESLNASIAAGIIMYEAARQKRNL